MEVLNHFDEVRNILGEPNPLASKKIYADLNDSMSSFIAASPMVMLSTVDSNGFPTISPKGEQAGFVRVEDKSTLLIPELRGNKLAFSLSNIVEQNKVALIFLVPGTTETLRIHGTCRLLAGNDVCQSLASKSHQALLVLEIKVTSAYFHCGKAFLRSQLWQPDSWLDNMKISLGQEIANNVGETPTFADDLDKAIKNRYITDL